MSRRPRLLVVTSTFPASRGDGTPSFVWDLAEREAGRFDTTVLAPALPGAPRHERAGSLDIHRFRYFFSSIEDLAQGAILDNLRARRSRWLQVLPFLAGEAIALRRLARRVKPDIIHVHWIVPQGIVARIVASGTPHVVTTLGGDVYALNGAVARALKRSVLKNAGAVTVMNQDMRRRLVALGADPATTLVIPMGAETGVVRTHATGERRLGRVLFAGRLVEKKGVSVLLRALRGIDYPWTLDVVGNGPLRERLEAEARPLGDRVRFLGTLDRPSLARAFGECTILAMPSVPAASGDQEGLPVALLEAMAAAAPIVASRLPGIDEVVEHKRSALLVPPNDPVALRDALVRLFDDDALRARLGGAAAKDAEAYSVDAIGERYVALLETVMAKQQPAGRVARFE